MLLLISEIKVCIIVISVSL